jgi:hypothetical protein
MVFPPTLVGNARRTQKNLGARAQKPRQLRVALTSGRWLGSPADLASGRKGILAPSLPPVTDLAEQRARSRATGSGW